MSESAGGALARKEHCRAVNKGSAGEEDSLQPAVAACKNKIVKARKYKLKRKYRNSVDNTHHHISPSGIIRKQPVDTDHPVWLKRGADVHHSHCGCHRVEEGSSQALRRGRARPAAGPAAWCPARRVYRPHLRHTKTEKLLAKDSSLHHIHG